MRDRPDLVRETKLAGVSERRRGGGVEAERNIEAHRVGDASQGDEPHADIPRLDPPQRGVRHPREPRCRLEPQAQRRSGKTQLLPTALRHGRRGHPRPMRPMRPMSHPVSLAGAAYRAVNDRSVAGPRDQSTDSRLAWLQIANSGDLSSNDERAPRAPPSVPFTSSRSIARTHPGRSAPLQSRDQSRKPRSPRCGAARRSPGALALSRRRTPR